jgi:cobalt/nickel transport system permease protein
MLWLTLPPLPEPVRDMPALHIPDGFLSLGVALLAWLITLPVLWLALQRSKGQFAERQIPLMGIMAAFIFAAQMINFPVAGGTSGHLVGGALAAIVLGPWAGMVVMASVVALQALLFQDGGLLVMGANILNMSLVPVVIGYGLYRAVAGRRRQAVLPVAGFAAWLSIMAGALATALQLWLSGTSPLSLVVPAMLAVHALIGLGEGLITVAALSFIWRTRPDVIAGHAGSALASRAWIAAGVFVSLLAVFLAPLASADPDGLERVAMDLGFITDAHEAPYAILPDYTVPLLGETALSTVLAGLIGLLAIATVVIILGRLLRAGREPAS